MRGHSLPFVGLVFACIAPLIANAQVDINEFLYDAPGTDADQEYVELYNSGGSAVDLTKWKINDGSNHTFNVPPKNGGTGSITLEPGGFALIVDNATNFIAAHPGLSGTVIDSVLSLPNASGTITLLDDTGATADSVSYTKDEGGNGDGNSLQKNAGVWIAALPTPDAANAEIAPAPPATTTDTSSPTGSDAVQTRTTTTSAPVPSYVPPPVPQVFADAGADRTVIVGADTQFNGRAYNRQGENLDHIRFIWNFGDGSTADGPSVIHHYEYPGRHALMLTIADNFDAVSDEVIVTAEPAKLAFDVPSDGSIAIENHAGRDLDLSGWIIRSFGQIFVLPEHSVILNGATMRISEKILKFWSGSQTELDYPNGIVMLHANETSTGSSAPSPEQTPAAPPQPTAPVAPRVALTVSAAPETTAPLQSPEAETAPVPTSATDDPATSSQGAAAAEAAPSGGAYWWFGAIALSTFAGGAVFAVRRVKAGEWDITEES